MSCVLRSGVWWGDLVSRARAASAVQDRNSRMADDSWGNSCKCNLRAFLICGIARACIHCILGLLWGNTLNKSRWLCSISQFKTGLPTAFWRWLSLNLEPTGNWPSSTVLLCPSRHMWVLWQCLSPFYLGLKWVAALKVKFRFMWITGVPIVHVGSVAPAVGTCVSDVHATWIIKVGLIPAGALVSKLDFKQTNKQKRLQFEMCVSCLNKVCLVLYLCVTSSSCLLHTVN